MNKSQVLEVSSICSAFAEQAIGSRVTAPNSFLYAVTGKAEETKFSEAGSAIIQLQDLVCEYVSSGVGKRSDNPNDYVLREHRGEVGAYLKRHLAARCTSVTVVVYTIDGYLADPDVKNDSDEMVRMCWHKAASTKYVLVAVLASSGEESPLTAGRLIHNIAGGNNDFVQPADLMHREIEGWKAGRYEKVAHEAKRIKEYWNKWSVVAD